MASSISAPTPFVVAGAVTLSIYFLALVIFDRYLSTRPSRELLARYLRDLQEQFGAHRTSVPSTDGPLTTLTSAQKRLEPRLRSLWTISATKVLSTWREAHRLETLAWQYASADAVNARLVTATAELHNLGRADATALAEKIAKVLEPTSSTLEPQSGVTMQARGRLWRFRLARRHDPSTAGTSPDAEPVQLLREAMRIIYDARDTKFESLADLQTKSVWLSVLGLILIVLASISQRRQWLFLFGALGAFISRLSRLLRRKFTDTDYGASSGALFLSPVAGALAGWLGVALVAALSAKRVHVLSDTFAGVWSHPNGTLPFLIATVFGFSERLLNRVLTTAEHYVDTSKTAATTPQSTKNA